MTSKGRRSHRIECLPQTFFCLSAHSIDRIANVIADADTDANADSTVSLLPLVYMMLRRPPDSAAL